MMSVTSTLSEMNERLSSDDASLGAELLGMILALGFFGRDQCHVGAALVAGMPPQLASHDVHLGNAVEAARGGDPAVDLGGRLLSLLLGMAVWLMVDPLAVTVESGRLVTAVLQIWLIANIGVMLTDPLAYIAFRQQTTTQDNGTS